MRSHRPRRIAGCLTALVGISLADRIAAQCQGDWLVREGQPGVTGSLPVNAAVTWDPDGAGPKGELLIVGGGFEGAGNLATFGIAAWDGEEWSGLGSGPGIQGQVFALAVYGGDLYVAGGFIAAGGVPVQNIARFDGTNWHAVGAGLNNQVKGLTVYNGELYACGNFTNAGGSGANYISRWNGSQWRMVGTGIGTGVNIGVLAMTVHNGELIAGGVFSTAGGIAADSIARWNGTSWSAMEDSLDVHTIDVLGVYNGEIIGAGTILNPVNGHPEYIMRWDGAAWRAMGSGLNDHALALTTFNGNLIAGGLFTNAGGVSAFKIAQWDGQSWSTVGGGGPRVRSLAVYRDELIVGGLGARASGTQSSLILRYDGASWKYLGGGMDFIAYAFETYNHELVAGGWFFQVGDIIANGIAARGPQGWHELGSGGVAGGSGYVLDLQAYDGKLIASGSFSSIGGVAANNVAQWNGQTWAPFGESGASVTKMMVHKGDLYATGSFGTDKRVAKWDPIGADWAPLGVFPTNTGMTAIAVHNGEIYAGGIGGLGTTHSIYRWDGSTWIGVGQPHPQAPSSIQTMVSYQGSLLAGGYTGLFRFNGTTWEDYGGGFGIDTGNFFGEVIAIFDLRVHDGELLVAGSFTHVGGQPFSGGTLAPGLARYNGSTWRDVGGGMNDAATNVHIHNGTIVAGGWFDMAGGSPAGFWAQWGCDCYANCDGSATSPVLTANDFQCFLNRFAAGDAYANCDGSSIAPVLTANDFQCFLNRYAAGCD
jgi:trimeric autotransporter adhesin